MKAYVKSLFKRVRQNLSTKKGFTLVEVLVVCVLFALIAVTVTAIISPMLRAYARANEIAEYNMILDNVGNTIASNLMQASDIEVADNYASMMFESSSVVFDVADGSLQKNGILVFAPNFYKGKSISFTITPAPAEPDFLVNVTVTSNSSGVTLSRSYAARPLLMIHNTTH